MSTKPGIPDHFSIHDVRDAAAGSPPAGGGTATRAQLHALRNLSIPFDLDHPPTFDDAARLIREAEEAENPMRVVMGPPVRDIREAMHPAGIISHEPPFARPAEPGDAPIAGALIEGAFPWIDPETIGFDPEIAKTIERAAHPLQTLLGGPHVATLPDGSRLDLPAGTVLREQGLAEQVRAGTLGVGMADDPAKLRGAFTYEHSPDVVLKQARDLLQRARVPLAETGAADVLAEIVAFLAGATPPEDSR